MHTFNSFLLLLGNNRFWNIGDGIGENGEKGTYYPLPVVSEDMKGYIQWQSSDGGNAPGSCLWAPGGLEVAPVPSRPSSFSQSRLGWPLVVSALAC